MSTNVPDHFAKMGEYYRSIESPFQNTIRSQERDRHNFLDENVGYLVGGLALSLIPVVPALLYWLVPRLMGPHQIRLSGLAIPINSFGLWWALCVCVSITLLWLTSALGKRISVRRKKHWLSDAQIRFALAYSIVLRLRGYELNKINLLFDDALKYWDELMPLLRKFFNPIPGPLVEQIYLTAPDLDEAVTRELATKGFPTSPGYHRTLSLFPQISALLMEPWFDLAPNTKAIVDGLNGMFSKLAPRLKERKELGKVADCLELLSGFLYSGLDSIAGRPINDWGVAQLGGFAASVNALHSYPATPTEAKGKPIPTSRRLLALVGKTAALFTHDSPLICFTAWLAVLAALVISCMLLAFRMVPTLKMDSTMVSLLIGTPILGAAAIVAVNASKRQS